MASQPKLCLLRATDLRYVTKPSNALLRVAIPSSHAFVNPTIAPTPDPSPLKDTFAWNLARARHRSRYAGHSPERIRAFDDTNLSTAPQVSIVLATLRQLGNVTDETCHRPDA